MINAYTVIGNPVAHSLSPAIHALFGELTQRRVRYTRTEAAHDAFEDVVRAWRAAGGRGANVTMPFKERAFALCDRVAPDAARAGAVNTIHMHRDGALVGHNTDGRGLVTDIEDNLGRRLAGARVLLLGAGGAARGAIGALADAGPAALHVANRTPGRAEALVAAERAAPPPRPAHRASKAAPGPYSGPVSGSVSGPVSGRTLPVASGYDGLVELDPFDVVVNATSLSFANDAPPLPDGAFAAGALGYDMAYGRGDTAFMRFARERGAHEVAGGFGMLVEQAAEAFLIWEGVRPKTRRARARLRALLDGA